MTLALRVFKKATFQNIPHLNALGSKFQGYQPSGSEEVLKGFTIYGYDDLLGHVTRTICINFGYYKESSNKI